MNDCFVNNNLLTHICQYLDYTSIIALSQCNKFMKKSLEPTNVIINLIYMLSVVKGFFQFSEDDEDNNASKKMDLLEKFRQTNMNWKNFLKEITLIFRNFEDKAISEKVKDCLQIHLYLPDLRKERPQLEFENSSIHLLTSYDKLFRINCEHNFYSKYITKDYLLNGLKNADKNNDKCIKILKEGIFFEEELKHYSNSFKDFINNEKYTDLVMNVLIKYDYEKLYDEYKNNEIHKYYKNNNIIKVILWINNIFILCCKYEYEYMNSLNENLDVKIFISEYIQKHHEIINIALILNSNFENINIIINQFLTNYPIFQINKNENYDEKNNISQLDVSIYSSTNSTMSSLSGSENNEIIGNFSLYKLFKNIMKKNFYEKLSERLTNNYIKLANSFSKNLFNNIEEIQNEKKNNEINIDEDELCDANCINCNDECENMDIDVDYDNISELLSEDKEPTEKELIENYINCLVDYEIDEQNANAINHTEIKMSKEYEKNEDILINEFIKPLNEKIIKEEKPLPFIYDIIEKNTKCRGNNQNLMIMKTDSLSFIRKTKKKLMKKSISCSINYALENLEKDFSKHIKINNKGENILYLNDIEIRNNNEYTCDLKDLSSKKKITITDKVNKEINNLKNYLFIKKVKTYEAENIKKEYTKLIDQFIDCDGIESVLAIKKMIWFYYKELGIYEEKNETVEKYLKGKNYCYLSENYSEACYENNKKLSEEELFFCKQ